LTGEFGGGDLSEVLARVQKLQEDLASRSSDSNINNAVEGSAGGGKVRVRVGGEFSFSSIRIDPSVVDAENVEFLEDLVLAAIRDATTQLLAEKTAMINEAMGSSLADLFGGLGTAPISDDAPPEPASN
jgi:DNA-binding YbaB/EbfC family protein